MRRSVLNACWTTIGLLLIAIGVLGIVVPGLPTTIFLLGASYAFYRGNERLAAWLDRHPVLGRYIAVAKNGRMPMRAKVISLAFMWAFVGLSLAFFLQRESPLWIPAVGTSAMALVGTWCIVRHGRRSARRPRTTARPAVPAMASVREAA